MLEAEVAKGLGKDGAGNVMLKIISGVVTRAAEKASTRGNALKPC